MTTRTMDVDAIWSGVQSPITITYSAESIAGIPVDTGRLVADFKYKPEDPTAILTLDSDLQPGAFIRAPIVPPGPDGETFSLTLVIRQRILPRAR